MKSKDLQPRVLYPASLSFKMQGEIRIFTDKSRLKEYTFTKPALQDMLKGYAIRRGRKIVREREKQWYKGLKINKYLSIITLNVNGLNAPIKRNRVAE